MMVFLFFLFLNSVLGVLAENCDSCVDSGKTWCVEYSECYKTSNSSCTTQIDLRLNCPTLPKFEYDDEFVRSQIWVMLNAVMSKNPQLCFDNQLPTMKLYKRREVNCSEKYENVTCAGYTAYDTTKKVIAIVFRGAIGQNQVKDMTEKRDKFGLKSGFNVTNGKILAFVHEYAMKLLNDGMKQDLIELKRDYPDFELWVNGISLGSNLAWAIATWIVDNGLYKPDDMKIIVMGAFRPGDYAFASWLTETFPYNFHVLHRSDPVSYLPRYLPVFNKTVFWPKTEVWYNNNMIPGEPFHVCQQADGDYCSALMKSSTPDDLDHLYYFNIDINRWGPDGCPKNISAYGQP
ncbi:hypothetical protein CAEBREN_06722 [Caenorhabditis brenneri]|uniref:Fungal lipase-type domain-containing protein n=1 Tax=Caenorhabditis brenneri TaxID=135651 RepID=G0M9V6_CAEBE|nr:hypothetical protein CAEBREN_06722 [Caenorhabditis brenneri]